MEGLTVFFGHFLPSQAMLINYTLHYKRSLLRKLLNSFITKSTSTFEAIYSVK